MSKTVSTNNISTPPSNNAETCSKYDATRSSNLTSQSYSVLPILSPEKKLLNIGKLEDDAYIKVRNQYRIYLMVYLLLFIIYILTK